MIPRSRALGTLTQYGRQGRYGALLSVAFLPAAVALAEAREKTGEDSTAHTAVQSLIDGSNVVAERIAAGSEWGRTVAKSRAEAALRVSRLCTTVSRIVADYELHDVKQSLGLVVLTPEQAQLEADLIALRSAQEAQAKAGIQEMNAITSHEKKEAHELSVKAGEDIINAALRMAHLEAAGVHSSKSDLHRAAAEKLLDLCRKNGGVYIKFGQHLAQLDYIVPTEYVTTLRCMLDAAPTTPIEGVREVIREELGKYPEELWDTFDPKPIASASLAQVHVATKDGAKLAIKVQHRGLRETSRGDIDAVRFVVRLLAWAFPKFSYEWLADEVAANLPKELDFVEEGKNAEKCASHFSYTDDIIIPKINWKHTNHRVLVMSFEEGVPACDTSALKSIGVSLPMTARLISKVFCEQTFVHGYLHCDPHGANLLVRRHPVGGRRRGRPQLVLLDHGLYRELDTPFRLNYCRLWRDLILGDINGIKQACENMNAGDAYPLLAAMITSRSWSDIVDVGLRNVHTEGAAPLIAGADADSSGKNSSANARARQKIVQSYVAQYMMDIQLLLAKVPRPLLLLLKTNDCLRHIDRSLGAPCNTFLISASTATQALEKEALEHPENNGVGGWGGKTRAQRWWRKLRGKVLLKASNVSWGVWEWIDWCRDTGAREVDSTSAIVKA